MLATARFTREFLFPRRAAVVVEEMTYRRGDESLPASLYRPRHVGRPLPGWMTLHGLTHHGRDHESLKRLARALAAAGSAVLVPDIPEWRALEVAPGAAVATIKAAVLELDALGLTEPGRIGAIGFSFGATQALIAATDPALEGHLAGVAAWGGYADIRTVSRFMFLGEHELDGTSYTASPDPYGRWILAGSYLGLLDDFNGEPGLAPRFLTLAREAARRRIMSWDPRLDPLKARLREDLSAGDREVFDLIAPATDVTLSASQRTHLQALVDRMLEAAIRREPLLDAAPYLGRIRVPIFLAHGRGDRLIPWTEMVRLRRALPADRIASSGVTSLFAHSGGERRIPSPGTAIEAARFLRLMRRMLGLI